MQNQSENIGHSVYDQNKVRNE